MATKPDEAAKSREIEAKKVEELPSKAPTTAVDDAPAIDAALADTMQPTGETLPAPEPLQTNLEETLNNRNLREMDIIPAVRKIIQRAEAQGVKLDLATPLQARLDKYMQWGGYSSTGEMFALAEENSIALQVHPEDCQKALKLGIEFGSRVLREVLAFAEQHGITLDMPTEQIRGGLEYVIRNCIHSYGIAAETIQDNIDFAREHGVPLDLESLFANDIQLLAHIGSYPDVQKKLIALAEKNGVSVAPTQENLQAGLIFALTHELTGGVKTAQEIEAFAKEYGYTLKWPVKDYYGRWTGRLEA